MMVMVVRKKRRVVMMMMMTSSLKCFTMSHERKFIMCTSIFLFFYF